MPAACSAQPRTNRGAAYFFNELWLTDTLHALWAGRIENVRVDGQPASSRRPWCRRRTIPTLCRKRSVLCPKASASAAQGPAVLDGRQRDHPTHSSARPARSSCLPMARTTHLARSTSAIRPENRDRQYRRARSQAHRTATSASTPKSTTPTTTTSSSGRRPASCAASILRPAARAPSSFRPSMPSATRSSAAAKSHGSGI